MSGLHGTDLANVTAAIIALAKGERVVSVTAGNRTVQYALTDLDKLRALKSEIETELGSSAGRWCFVLTTTSKGLWLRYLKLLDQHGNQISRSSLSGSFEAAGSGRRLGVWGMSSAGPNTVLWSSLSTLRSRVRELIRNNPIAESGVESWVANLIGTELTPRWKIKDQSLKAELQELWADWTLEADAYGTTDLYGL